MTRVRPDSGRDATQSDPRRDAHHIRVTASTEELEINAASLSSYFSCCNCY